MLNDFLSTDQLMNQPLLLLKQTRRVIHRQLLLIIYIVQFIVQPFNLMQDQYNCSAVKSTSKFCFDTMEVLINIYFYGICFSTEVMGRWCCPGILYSEAMVISCMWMQRDKTWEHLQDKRNNENVLELTHFYNNITKNWTLCASQRKMLWHNSCIELYSIPLSVYHQIQFRACYLVAKSKYSTPNKTCIYAPR